MRLAFRVAAQAVAVLVLAALVLAVDIALTGLQSDGQTADAAIVLGAAVADDTPTPVFEERLRHAVELYQSGRVRLLVMTGGKGPGDALSEGAAARDFALNAGVPADAIVVEDQSHTTRENFADALPLLAGHDVHRVLVVSDPLHLSRALRMAADLGIDAHPSPTPTSRYRTLTTQVPMLLRELWFRVIYGVTGT